MQDFFSILSNFGFPVTVAAYLLFRFEKKIDDGTQTNGRLVQINEKLIEEITELKKLNSDLVKEIKYVQNKINQLEKMIKGFKKKI
jgi:uncharacterized protein YlzI (FlbEa/FlbD family)